MPTVLRQWRTRPIRARKSKYYGMGTSFMYHALGSREQERTYYEDGRIIFEIRTKDIGEVRSQIWILGVSWSESYKAPSKIRIWERVSSRRILYLVDFPHIKWSCSHPVATPFYVGLLRVCPVGTIFRGCHKAWLVVFDAGVKAFNLL